MMTNASALAGVVVKELYRRKDFYVLFVLTALLTLLLGSISFFNEQNIARYMKEFCLLLIWIASLVIAITTTARQIPTEREQRTIFPLLAKPVSRGDLIFGKFLGCWMASGMALLVFYIFFAAITGSREQHFSFVSVVQAFWLHWMMLGVVVGMVLLGSILFSAPSVNSTIAFVVVLGILFLGRHLNKVAMGLPEPSSSILYSLYYLIPHLEFYDIRDRVIHNVGPVSWWALGVATIYAAVYSALFQMLVWVSFRRKTL